MGHSASVGYNYYSSHLFEDHSASLRQVLRNCSSIDSLQRSKSVDSHKSCFELS
jgi:hypothetical protein